MARKSFNRTHPRKANGQFKHKKSRKRTTRRRRRR
jgi:hypothetical protein